jgi:hypothetical protein
MLKYSHPTLALVLDYWPITIFAPTVLLLIATLALITRWWDRRDQAAQESVRAAASPAGAVVARPTARLRGDVAPTSPRPNHFGHSGGQDARAAS